jgi:hypothetical protein
MSFLLSMIGFDNIFALGLSTLLVAEGLRRQDRKTGHDLPVLPHLVK